jgi:hypothetical protein
LKLLLKVSPVGESCLALMEASSKLAAVFPAVGAGWNWPPPDLYNRGTDLGDNSGPLVDAQFFGSYENLHFRFTDFLFNLLVSLREASKSGCQLRGAALRQLMLCSVGLEELPADDQERLEEFAKHEKRVKEDILYWQKDLKVIQKFKLTILYEASMKSEIEIPMVIGY